MWLGVTTTHKIKVKGQVEGSVPLLIPKGSFSSPLLYYAFKNILKDNLTLLYNKECSHGGKRVACGAGENLRNHTAGQRMPDNTEQTTGLKPSKWCELMQNVPGHRKTPKQSHGSVHCHAKHRSRSYYKITRKQKLASVECWYGRGECGAVYTIVGGNMT